MPSKAFFMGSKIGIRRREGRFIIPASGYPRIRKFQRGQATLELLIVLIILIPLIFGAIELSRAVTVKAALDSGVGVAARALALNPNNWNWAAAMVATTVGHNVFGTAGLGPVNFGAVDGSNSSLDRWQFAALPFGATFCVRGWMTYSPQVPLLTLNQITIRVEHCGVIERVD
jgi:hypothetical protein